MSIAADPREVAYFEELQKTRELNERRAKDGLPPVRLTMQAPDDGLELNADGTARLFYAGNTPWHGKGTRVAEAVTSEQAMTLAGQDWSVVTGPLWGGPNQTLIETMRSIYRETDGKVLGVASTRYMPIQNREMFDFLDSLVEDRIMRYHTAGVLHGGKVVWILAQLEEDIRIAGEPYVDYLLCTSGHDNWHPLEIIPTRRRVFCNNTLRMAQREATMRIRIRHTGNIAQKFAAAKKVLGVTTAAQRRYAEWLEQLAETRMTEEQVVQVRDGLFGSLDDATPTRRREAINTWVNMLNAEEALHPESAYAVLNAITGYADHGLTLRTSKVNPGEERLTSFLGGTGNVFKEKGLKVLEAVTGVSVTAAVN